jgi:uncharacterized membrane protein YedE/YeeE
MVTLVVAFVLAAILGFAAHRASVCTVRAVAEVVSSRTVFMFGSVAKTVLWVSAVTIPVLWLVPSTQPVPGWQFSAWAVAGGFVFGIGAAINGACAYSTMARLMDGEGGMLATIVGFAVGVFLFVKLLGTGIVPRPAQTPTIVASTLNWLLLITVAVLAWGIYELVRLWRTRPAGSSVKTLLCARQYRLSTAAVLMGVASATLVLLYGPLGYTSTFEQLIESGFGMIGLPIRPSPPPVRWIILIAVLAGMLLSTLERGSFRVDFRPRGMWIRNLCGGLLMGLGVALIPGGNDALVLYAIPSLSPHALPAYLAMAAGIAAALLLMRWIFGVHTRVQCRDDLFITESGVGNRQAVITEPPPPAGLAPACSRR